LIASLVRAEVASAQSANTEDVSSLERTPRDVGQPDSNPPQAHVWNVDLDGVLFGMFNHQGGRRGSNQFRSTNWLMAMGRRPIGASGTLTLTGMVSAEPLTVGLAGYAELFQEGEAYHQLQNTDRQHPHDLLMQLSAAFSMPVGDKFTLTIAGGPVGEPSLGPVPFMHRPSSADNPAAPLSHHIFDSTHSAQGVILARADRGPVSIEGSIFRGREPDEDRYDLDLGALDSWAARIWFRPRAEWTLQASYGFLHEPEELEPGDQRRTNGSISWFRQRGNDFSAATVAFGRTARPYSVVSAVLAEAATRFARTSLYARFERRTVETEILLFPEIVHRPHPGELVDPIRSFTAGAVRDVVTMRGLSVGVGGDVTFYGVPALLQVTDGPNPVSFHVFFRVCRSKLSDRMWNETMGGHGTTLHRHPM
jgi:hypothetical protein